MCNCQSALQSANSWLALAIGNSRLHWAWFDGEQLVERWDTPHLDRAAIAQDHRSNALHGLDKGAQRCAPTENWVDRNCLIRHPKGDRNPDSPPPTELWLASVVPEQTRLWQEQISVYQTLTLAQVPIAGLYPTLGIDRALALWGALEHYHAPALVIDAGTALTLTAADGQGRLVGGAILPGLQLQWRSLAKNTAALPFVASASLPPRWALNTADAIRSGVVYTAIAGLYDYVTDWLGQFPQSAIAITGGDGAFLHQQFTALHPDRVESITLDPDLLFWGMRSVRQRLKQHS
ncbi:MAG TPA: pantothenate kinase [Chroococcidiopsis sp.]